MAEFQYFGVHSNHKQNLGFGVLPPLIVDHKVDHNAAVFALGSQA